MLQMVLPYDCRSVRRGSNIPYFFIHNYFITFTHYFYTLLLHIIIIHNYYILLLRVGSF